MTINPISFRADAVPTNVQNTQSKSQPPQPEEQKEGMSDTTKVAIGAGVAVVAALAIYALTRKPGTVDKAVQDAAEAAKKAAQEAADAAKKSAQETVASVKSAQEAATLAKSAQEAAENAADVAEKSAQKAVDAAASSAQKTANLATDLTQKVGEDVEQQLQKLSITEFKTKGKFEKGKALLDGKGFTGQIEVPVSDTRKIGATMTYKDGVLQESLLSNGVTKKYGVNGRIVDVYDSVQKKGRTIYKGSDGKLRRIEFVEDGQKVTENMKKAVNGESELSQKAILYDEKLFSESEKGEILLYKGKPFTGVVLKESKLPDGGKIKIFANVKDGEFINAENYIYDNSGKIEYYVNLNSPDDVTNMQLVNSNYIYSNGEFIHKDGYNINSAIESFENVAALLWNL